MPARSTVLIGPAGSGKTEILLTRYRAALVDGVPGSALWLAPTVRSADSVRQRLLSDQLPACFSPRVMTFDRFAEAVLRASPTSVRPIGEPLQRQLVSRLIAEAAAAGRLNHFRLIAETPGFVDLVCQFIREWKRMEIWPEQFRDVCRQQGETAKDVELADLYSRYQQQLIDHQLYDAEGRFWTARSLLREGQRQPLENLKLVVVDGFTDFTRTQHEILEILGQRVAEIMISLPGESAGHRHDLFAKPRKTLKRLEYGLSDLTQQAIERPTAAAWPAMAQLERRLFQNPADVTPSKDARGIEIVAATGQHEELVRIGGHIKALLTVGDPRRGSHPVAPDDIMVVLRSLSSVDSLLREVFTEQGIPFVIESGQRLDRCPALASLVSMLRLEAESWPVPRLLSVLNNNYFRPSWPEAHGGRAVLSAISVLRRLSLFSGRQAILESIQRRLKSLEAAAADAPVENESERRVTPATEAEACRLALGLLLRLGDACDRLPRRATAGEWVEQLQRFAADVGFLAALEEASANCPTGFDDRAAFGRLLEVLVAPDEVSRLTASEVPHWDRPAFFRLLADTLRSIEIRPPAEPRGRVRVLSAASARALSVPYLFVAGLSEKSFPPPEREDRAYSEAEYVRLAEAGLPLVLREERGHEEMLLFYEVATRATSRLTLSYPALDEKAQPQLASPFVSDVERLFTVFESSPTADTARLSPVPPPDELFSPRSYRLRAMSDALVGDEAQLRRLLRSAATRKVGRRILAGLSAIHARSQTPGFGVYEGMFAGDAAAARLAERFGPDRAWSASVLERYMACPFRFLLADVLRLEEPPETQFEIDRRRRGSLMHRLLAALHRQLQREGRSPTDLDEETYRRRYGELLAQFLSGRASESPLASALSELDRRQLCKWAEQYRQQFEKYLGERGNPQEPPTPSHFEVAFGLGDETRYLEAEHDQLSTNEPLRLTLRERTVLISGMIDRIDLARHGDQEVFNVVDYKTGNAPANKDVASGQALQLALYAMAAESLLLADRQATPWQIGYWKIKDQGFRASMKLADESADGVTSSDAWQDLQADLTQKVHSLIQGIHRGQFPMHSTDKHCTDYCPYHTVCRVRQVRALEKTWQPPQLD